MFVNLPDISCSNISLGVQDPKKSSGMEIKLALSVEIATKMIKIGNKSTYNLYNYILYLYIIHCSKCISI